VTAIPSVSSSLSFNGFCFLVEILWRQVIVSPADMAEYFISLLAREFGFEGGRLQRYERKRVCMRRRMKVIGFSEFLTLEIHKFTHYLLLRWLWLLVQTWVWRFAYANHLKGLNKCKITLLVTEVSSKGWPERREFINKTWHLVIVRYLVYFRLKVSDKIL